MKVFIGIGIEQYLEQPLISPVKYAEADVREFAHVLEQHGFDKNDRLLLINDQATQSRIRSVLRSKLSGLENHDTLYLYFAGRGATVAGTSYLACYDSIPSDFPDTSIPISWLVEQFKKSACQKIVLFLDSSPSGLLGDEGTQDSCSDLTTDELGQFFADAQHCICFAACKSDESSFPSTDFKHGIWPYHLIEAFDGRAEAALTRGRLTGSSLQNYLGHAVPMSLRSVNPAATQTPWQYGGANSDFELADLTDILASRKAAKHPHDGQIADSILASEESQPITRLPGFEKKRGHFVPDRVSSDANDFIGRLVATQVEAELKQVRDHLKRQFEFGRKECQISCDGGIGTVTTPKFNYNIVVFQDEDHCENVVWRRSIEGITDSNAVLSDDFASVFPSTFNAIELRLHGRVDLDRLVDVVEEIKRVNKDIDVAYDDDRDISSCVISMAGHPKIRVTHNTFVVLHGSPATPRVLIEALFNAQVALTRSFKVDGIPFAGAG